MNRATVALALDIPQRHFRGADCGKANPAAAQVQGAVHHSLPARLDLERVLTEQEITQSPADRVGERSIEYRLEDSRNRVPFADAFDTLVGQNTDNESVLRTITDLTGIRYAEDDRFDIGDAHRTLRD